MTRRAHVLCPLEIERRAAARAVGSRAIVTRTGPGAEPVARAVAALDPADTRLVVLVGVAGGLRSTALAPAITGAVDAQTGERWTPTVVPPGPAAVVVGVDQPVLTPGAKRILAAGAGADLTDCESHAFARACAAAALPWAIVRGVSDGPDDTLPPDSIRWVDERGVTRPGRVALDLMRRPWGLPGVLRLGRTTTRALHAATVQLVAVLDLADTIARDADDSR